MTWTVDVAPILAARCARCHRADGFGPMSLATYDEAKSWAAAIRAEVLSGRMPPWSARAGFGDFANDARLSNVEAELVAKWVEGGAPRGADATRPAVKATGAPAPALVDRFALPAVEVSAASLQTFTMPTAYGEDRWLTGWEFEPGARALVDSASLAIAGAQVGTWTAFDGRIAYPRGIGDRISRGGSLTVSIQYRRPSETRVDRSTLILYLDRKPAHEPQHAAIGCGSRVLDRDVMLLSVTPRAASAGDSIEIAAYRPDGAIDPLCLLSGYRPEYPVQYRLRAPLRLERGSRVDVRSSEPGCDATIDYVPR